MNSIGAKLNDEGVELHKKGLYKQAIDCYERALKENPGDAYACYNKGLAHYELSNYSEAIRAYDEALRIDHKFFQALTNKGFALNKLFRYEEAIKCFDEAMKSHPSDNRAQKGRDDASEKLAGSS
jgi:tetratricopeptide (TPR) repeat protein